MSRELELLAPYNTGLLSASDYQNFSMPNYYIYNYIIMLLYIYVSRPVSDVRLRACTLYP